MIILIIISLTSLAGLHAQDVLQHVLSSGSGTAAALNGDNVQYTIGQAFVANTLSSNNSAYLTQGFEQPTFSSNQQLIVNAAFPDLNLMKLDVYPNPAVDYTEIALNLIDNEGVQIAITDIWGQVIKSENYRVEAGSQKIHFAFGALSAGVYTIRVKANQTVYAKKLLVSGSITSARN